jgi:hypothetical protein
MPTPTQPIPYATAKSLTANLTELFLGYRGRDRATNVRVAAGPYPATVDESIDDSLRYRAGVLQLVAEFAVDHPFRGTNLERFRKLAALHVALCDIYGRFPILCAEGLTGEHSGGSSFSPVSNTITLRGRLSVITYLHEFGHALGKNEAGACRWSLNIFKRVFPVAFSRLTAVNHTLTRPQS